MKRFIQKGTAIFVSVGMLFSVGIEGEVFAKTKSQTIQKSGRTISLKVGEKAKLSFPKIKQLKISVTHKKVIKVKKKGKKAVVTALKAGSASLTAKGSGKKYVVKFKVTQKQTDNLENTPEATLQPRATNQPGMTGTPGTTNQPGMTEIQGATNQPGTTGTLGTNMPAQTNMPVTTNTKASEKPEGTQIAEKPSGTSTSTSEQPSEVETTDIPKQPSDEETTDIPKQPSDEETTDIPKQPSDEEATAIPKLPSEVEATGTPGQPSGIVATATPNQPSDTTSTIAPLPGNTPAPVSSSEEEYNADTVDVNDFARYFSPSAIHHSTATYYDNGYTNTCCNLDDIASAYDVCAINEYDYNAGLMAGAYLEVTGPLGKVNVLVTDLMPYAGNESNCTRGALDLNENTFAKIANKIDGKVAISWKVIAFPTDGPVQYKFKDGSSQWWAEVQVRNTTYPVKKLEVKNPDGSYTELPRMNYNYFQAASGLGSDTVTFRVTDLYDRVREDTVTVMAGTIQNGTGNFSIFEQ